MEGDTAGKEGDSVGEKLGSGDPKPVLTVLVSAEVGFRVRGGLGLAGLVDGDDPELVPLALAQAGDACLQFVDPATLETRQAN